MAKKKVLDLKKIKTYPLSSRSSKVWLHDLAKPLQAGGTFMEFFESLPNILAGQDLRAVVEAMLAARQGGHNIMVGMGAHVIKVGAGPLLIQWMERGFLSALAVNGACLIHDSELAMIGSTSEDVAQELKGGHFGMAKDTADLIHEAYYKWRPDELGFANFLGRLIVEKKLPYQDKSILAAAARLEIPATAHVTIGADIIHMSASADGAKIGKAALADFRLFAAMVAALDEGVFLNLGSAVVIPETFLKAISLTRNLGHSVSNFTSVTIDFIKQYRAMENVVRRPTLDGGRGYYLIGPHELIIPLITAALLEKL